MNQNLHSLIPFSKLLHNTSIELIYLAPIRTVHLTNAGANPELSLIHFTNKFLHYSTAMVLILFLDTIVRISYSHPYSVHLTNAGVNPYSHWLIHVFLIINSYNTLITFY